MNFEKQTFIQVQHKQKKLYANLSTYPWTEFTVPINFVPNSNQNRSNATNELVIMFHVAVDEAETSDNI